MSDHNRVTLVTGASRGIGKAVSLELAKRGHHVIALARTFGGLEELADEIDALKSGAVTLIPQDLTDFNALESLGPSLFERFGRLDGFIGNAGMLGRLMPLAQTDPKLCANVFQVNVMANSIHSLPCFRDLRKMSQHTQRWLQKDLAAGSTRLLSLPTTL